MGKKENREGGKKGNSLLRLMGDLLPAALVLAAGLLVVGTVLGEKPARVTVTAASSAPEGPGEEVFIPDEEVPLAALPELELEEEDVQPTTEYWTESPQTARARELAGAMSLREKVCQLLMTTPDGLVGLEGVTVAGETTAAALGECPVGGLYLPAESLHSAAQVSRLLSQLQQRSATPLLLACSEEGGSASALAAILPEAPVGEMFSYRAEGAKTAWENARTVGAALRELGFNMNLAPVADVWSDPENDTIGPRAYSDSFTEAGDLVYAAVKGYRHENIACVLKHFPGVGELGEDGTLSADPDSLRREELEPFRGGIEAEADGVLIGSALVPALDSAPAPLSRAVITGLLREELGFRGVVISDLTGSASVGEAAVQTVQAGADLLLCPEGPEAAAEALARAVEEGALSPSRLEESVVRVLTLKLNRGIIPMET